MIAAIWELLHSPLILGALLCFIVVAVLAVKGESL